MAEQSTAVGKIKQLTTIVRDLLRDYHKQHLLSWHDGGIPQNEIWLKLGSDHGGGSFKFCLQVLNVKHPNSKNNTFLVRTFEAKDNVENLKRVLCSDEFKQETRPLHSMAWRGKRVRVFLCGDYDLFCKTFGLLGARGFHPCLWCLTAKDKIQKGPVRSSTAESYQKFKKLFSKFPNSRKWQKIKGEGI